MRFRVNYHHDDVPRYVNEAEARAFLRNIYREETEWSLHWARLVRGEPVELPGRTIRRVDNLN